MKVDKAKVRSSIDSPDPSIRLFLFHGGDEAGSRALAGRLLSSLGATKTSFNGATAKSDPGSLLEQAGAISLFGEKQALWIEPAGEEIVAATELLLGADAVESPVIAVGGALKRTSGLLKLAEAHRQALAFVSYPLSERDINQRAMEIGRAEGLRMSHDVATRVAGAAGLNQAILASELQKFALYLGAEPTSPRELTHDVLDQLSAEHGDEEVRALGDLALDGRLAMLGEALQNLSPVGSEGVMVARQLQRRVLQILPLRARVEAGERADAVMTSAGKSLFFKERGLVTRLLSSWTAARLAQVAQRAVELERRLMLSAAPSDAVLGEELMAIARAARR